MDWAHYKSTVSMKITSALHKKWTKKNTSGGYKCWDSSSYEMVSVPPRWLKLRVTLQNEISPAWAGGASGTKELCAECVFVRSFITEYLLGSAD